MKIASSFLILLVLSGSISMILVSSTALEAYASDPGGTFFPRLDTDANGDVHIAWWNAATGNNEIYYEKVDGATGEHIIEEMQISFARGFSARPDIELDSANNVHIVWLDRRISESNAELFYEKLDNNGNVIVDQKRITFAEGNSVRPSIILDSQDNIHVAWYDNRNGNDEIYYKKLDNNGNTLIDDVRVTNAAGLSQRPYIDVDSQGDVHIHWMDTRDGGDYEMYYAKLDGNTGTELVGDKRLTNTQGLSGRNALLIDSDDNIHMTWMESIPLSGNLEIVYVKLDNNGNPLTDANNDGFPDLVYLTNDPRQSVRPDMDLDSSGNPHVVWVDERDGNREIYYTKLDNDGNTLIDDTRVSTSDQISDRTYVAVDPFDDVHVVWQDDRSGRPELWYSKLDNNGNVLIDDTQLSHGHPFADPPASMLDSSGNLHVIWADDRESNIELFYTKINAGTGATIVDDKRVTNMHGYSNGPSSLLMDSSNNIHLVWQDNREGNFEIFWTKLDSSGNQIDVNNNGILTDDQKRLTFNLFYSYYPQAVLDSSGNVHITWQDSKDTFRNIYYMKVNNNGNILKDVTQLTFTTTSASRPDIAIDSSNNLHIVWFDGRNGNFEIYYTKLDSTGNVLVDDLRLTNNAAFSSRPAIAVDASNNVHVVWQDDRDGNVEIYYTKLGNNGNTLVDDTRITNAGGASLDADIGVSSLGDIVLTWSDNRNGNGEIYFVRLDSNGVRKNANDVRVTIAAGKSYFVTLDADKSTGSTNLIWTDLRDPHFDIPELYYAKLKTFGGKLIPDTRLTFTCAEPC